MARGRSMGRLNLNLVLVLGLIFMMSPTFCGKTQYPSQGVPLKKVLEATPQVTYKKTLDLAHSSLSDIKGIKKLPVEKCKKLNLSRNHLGNIKPLLKITSETVQYIYLQRNNLKNFSQENLRTLKENFPNLALINLRKNGIKKRKALRQAGKELELTILLKKKKTTTITIEDD